MKIITFFIFAFFVISYVGCLSAKHTVSPSFNKALALNYGEEDSITNFTNTINLVDESDLERIYTIDLLLFDENQRSTKIIVFAPPLAIVKD